MSNNSKYLEPGEVLEHVIYHHILAVGKNWASALLILIVVDFFAWPLWQQGIYGQILIGVLLLVAVLTIVRAFIIWLGSRVLVTNHRIIDTNQTGFFTREVSSAYFESVQDVSWQKTGLLSTIFKYGSVVIIYGQNSVKLLLTHIKYPNQTVNQINNKLRK